MLSSSAKPNRPRLLFFAEAVTLAHVARPAALGAALDGEHYDVHLACHLRYNELLGEAVPCRHAIDSITPQQFLDALSRGAPLYDEATLNAYVEQDLALIAELQPAVILGDMRLSLAVSAALAGIPYIALSNAYWSPYCRQRFTVPELPFSRLLGPAMAQAVFSVARPIAFALHSLPMQRLRRRHGLPGLGLDLRQVYTHGDFTLYADPPDLFNMQALPANHRFIGPVVWSPQCELPPWWEQLPADRPLLYVTLGSSGQAHLLPAVLQALSQLEVTAMVATAGAPLPAQLPANVFTADYLPGEAAVARADLVVCNGGSPTSHQALVQGVPVLGLAGNLDQYLNMAALERAGAGVCLRSGTLTMQSLASAVGQMLANDKLQRAASQLQQRWGTLQPARALTAVITEILGPQQSQHHSALTPKIGVSL